MNAIPFSVSKTIRWTESRRIKVAVNDFLIRIQPGEPGTRRWSAKMRLNADMRPDWMWIGKSCLLKHKSEWELTDFTMRIFKTNDVRQRMASGSGQSSGINETSTIKEGFGCRTFTTASFLIPDPGLFLSRLTQSFQRCWILHWERKQKSFLVIRLVLVCWIVHCYSCSWSWVCLPSYNSAFCIQSVAIGYSANPAPMPMFRKGSESIKEWMQ